MSETSAGSEEVAKSKHFLSPAQRADWVRRFVESGASVPQFCDEHRLVPVTLYRWLARAGHAKVGLVRSAAAEAPLAFTEIKLTAPTPVETSSWAAELCRPNGTILRLGAHAPTGLVEQLLRIC